MGRGKKRGGAVGQLTGVCQAIDLDTFRTQAKTLAEQITDQGLYDLTDAGDVAQLYLDFEENKLNLLTRHVADDGWQEGTPESEWHACACGIDLVANPGDVLDVTWFRHWLTHEDTLALLDTIWDGVDIEWDGSNEVGRWTSESGEARDALATSALESGLSREHVMGRAETIDWLTSDRQTLERDIEAALAQGKDAEAIAEEFSFSDTNDDGMRYYPDLDTTLELVKNIINELADKQDLAGE